MVRFDGKEVMFNVKHTNTSNKILAIMAIAIAAFIACMIVTYWVKGGVPDTLIQYTLGAGGVEALAMAMIKITKVRNENGGTDDEDQLETEADEP